MLPTEPTFLSMKKFVLVISCNFVILILSEKKMSTCSISLRQLRFPLPDPNSRGEFNNYTKLLWFVHSRHSRSVLIKTNLISFQIKLVAGNLYYLIKQNANRKWNIHSDWLPTDSNLTKLHFALFLYLISYTPRQIKCYPEMEVTEAFHWDWEVYYYTLLPLCM